MYNINILFTKIHVEFIDYHLGVKNKKSKVLFIDGFCFICFDLRWLNNQMIYIADYIDSVNETDSQTDNIDSIVIW